MLTFSTSKFSYIRYYSVANCKNGCYITFHIICFIIYLPLFVCACYEPVGAIKLCKSKTTTCKLLCVMNFEMDFGENQFQNFRFQNFNLANLVYLFSSWNTSESWKWKSSWICIVEMCQRQKFPSETYI